jgi:hypothetical protein
MALSAGCSRTEEAMVPQVRAVRKSETAPPIKHCVDATGHQRGAKPFILGGTCCCTPTPKLVEGYHRDGLLLDYDITRLKSAYDGRGIKTDLDHLGCNNLCPYGPHIVKGGKCMATPTPGTQNYEEIISGCFPPPVRSEKQQTPTAK